MINSNIIETIHSMYCTEDKTFISFIQKRDKFLTIIYNEFFVYINNSISTATAPDAISTYKFIDYYNTKYLFNTSIIIEDYKSLKILDDHNIEKIKINTVAKPIDFYIKFIFDRTIRKEDNKKVKFSFNTKNIKELNLIQNCIQFNIIDKKLNISDESNKKLDFTYFNILQNTTDNFTKYIWKDKFIAALELFVCADIIIEMYPEDTYPIILYNKTKNNIVILSVNKTEINDLVIWKEE